MIYEKVKEILIENLACDEEDISLDSHLIEDLEADSLDIVELSMEMEEEFGIEVPDEDLEKLQTVESIVTYIERMS